MLRKLGVLLLGGILSLGWTQPVVSANDFCTKRPWHQKCQKPVPTPTPTPSPTSTLPPPPTGFVTRQGKSLFLGGQPYKFTGLNIYNANSRWNCWYPLGYNDNALLDTLNLSRVKTFRAWFFQRLATTNGVRDWAAFDHTLEIARQKGVKVVVTLTDMWGACEGNELRYTDWYQTGYRTIVTDLVPYRDYVAEIVARYRTHESILMWQLGNELETKNRDGTCGPVSALASFASDMTNLIRSIDPNHLISLGTIGSGQCGTQGSEEFKLIHQAVDLCEYHDYGYPDSAMPGDVWNGLQVRINDCAALNKPLFVGEVGIEQSDPNRAQKMQNKLLAQFGAGVVGFLPWEWRAPNQTDGDAYIIEAGDPVLEIL